MSRTLTEKKVLNKLGIDSFREITKEKVIEMVSMYDKMDPEVAKKAIPPNIAAKIITTLIIIVFALLFFLFLVLFLGLKKFSSSSS